VAYPGGGYRGFDPSLHYPIKSLIFAFVTKPTIHFNVISFITPHPPVENSWGCHYMVIGRYLMIIGFIFIAAF